MRKQTSGQLCPKCKTGAESYKLDPKSPMCPYLEYHNGKTCPYFSELSESEVNKYEKVRGDNHRNA